MFKILKQNWRFRSKQNNIGLKQMGDLCMLNGCFRSKQNNIGLKRKYV